MIAWSAAFHWSYTDPGWAGFFAHERTGLVMLRYELNWHEIIPEDAAEEFVAFQKDHKMALRGVYAQVGIFPKAGTKSRGETVSETFQRNGVPVQRSHADVPSALSRLRSWLEPRKRPDGKITPSLVIHRSCEQFLRTLPSLVADPKDKDTIEETPDMFPALGATYFVMSRPLPTRAPKAELPPDAIGHEVEKIRRALQTGL